MSIFVPESPGLLMAANSTIPTMLKQILAKIPRKSTKSNQTISDVSNPAADLANTGTFTNTCNVISSRLNVVKKMSSSIFPTSNNDTIQPHIPFKDVQNSEKPKLLISKLNLCSKVYNFNDQDNDTNEKDVKRQVLVEILDFLVSDSLKLTEPVMSAICKMCGDNLFRDFPPKYANASFSGGESEVDDPWFDPSWSHLQLVYEILLRFVSLASLDPKTAKQYLNQSFVLRLLNLFNSEDPRERDCLKSVLHRIYGKFMAHRPFIRVSVSNIIYRFVFETEKHNGISELLEIFGSVISGFALPLKKEHKIFFSRVLIPLHKPKSIGNYHHQLTYCIVQFIEKDPKLTSVVINGMLKYWPITSSQKQLMFLSELEELLELIRTDEFEKIMVPLFQRISFCLDSYHFQVAERAHFLWNNEHINHLIMCNRHVIMPIVFSSLQRNSDNHWNRTVLNLTQNVMKMFKDADQQLVLTCQGKYEDDMSAANVAAERRRSTWEQLENVAGVLNLEKTAATCVVSC